MVGPGKFKFGPILTATVLTVLRIWLFKTVAQVFVLLMLGVLISLYLGAVAALDRASTRMCRNGPALAAGDLRIRSARSSLLGWILVPPVIEQTRQLVAAAAGVHRVVGGRHRQARRHDSRRCATSSARRASTRPFTR